MDNVKVGDYVVYTEKKIRKRLELIENKLLGTFMYESQMKNLEIMKNRVYIFKEWIDEERFTGQENEMIFSGLLASEFRVATLKEKIKYDLSQIYNK